MSVAAPAAPQAPSDWHDANREDLSARVAVVSAYLRVHAAGDADKDAARDVLDAALGRAHETAQVIPGVSATDSLVAAFGLTPFERDVLLLSAGIELDGDFASRCAKAHGDPHRQFPTFGLALAALPDPHWSAIVPAAPLRWWHLVDLSPADGPTTSLLRIDERVLHYLTGIVHLDERLQGLVTPVPDHDDLSSSRLDLASRLAALWSRGGDPDEVPTIQLWGEDRAGAIGVAAHACHLLGLHAHRIRASDIPVVVTDRELLGRLWQREAVLSTSALLIELEDHETGDRQTAVRAASGFADGLRGRVALISREPVPGVSRPGVRFHVPPNDAGERRTIWLSVLGEAGTRLNGRLDPIVAQFDLGSGGIRVAGADALAQVATGDLSDDGLAAALWEACRSQARTRLDDLAQRIEPAASWDDLVLPEMQGRMLREVALHVRNRTTVYETWGFGRKSRRGLGISGLFAGPSGTGKTMAAEVLANELRLDLYRIDLSQVVSKYIGETEKNLRRVFDAAEEGGSILLFDEADALFGKRSEVKDSHDRYANIEVGYLLQRMESYRGLAILTTNMKSALDGAFLRRLRFVVQFPFPDQSQRTEIWRRIFPVETPTEGVDVAALARLNVAGGNIRNIAMNAAFLAADARQPVRMEHLLRAARAEYAKLEKPLTEAEVGGWA